MSSFSKIMAAKKKKVKEPEFDGIIPKLLKTRKHVPRMTFGWSDDYESIRCSKASDLCVRQAVYARRDKLEGKPEPLDFAGEVRMQMGTDMHYYLQNDVFGPMGFLIGNWICTKCQSVYNDSSQVH